jgi:hypothetical protein
MKNKNYLFIAGALILSISLLSCQKSGKIIFSEAPVDTTRIIANDIQKEGATKQLVPNKGATWRLWRKINIACMQSDWLTKAYYFGTSGNINLGAIVDKNYDLQRTMDATSGFNEVDINTVTNYGVFSTCENYIDMSMSLNTFLKCDFNFPQIPDPSITAELSNAIKNSNNSSVKIDGWRINNIREDNFTDILNDSCSNNKIKAYKNTLLKKDHLILIKVIEIKGFTSRIQLAHSISTQLKAQLENGVIAQLGNAGIETSFTLVGSNVIEVKSQNNFFVFGEFKKCKFIQE